MRRALMSIIAALVACGEPSVHLEIIVPEAYRERVDQIVLQTLEPREDRVFHCDEASFGLVDDAELDAARDSEEILRDTRDQSIGAVSRTGTKLFWAEALTPDGAVALLGCAELETIEEDRSLEIVLEPVRVPSIEGEDRISYELLLDGPVRVRASDIFGDPLTSLEVRHRSLGPEGRTKSGTISADRQGLAEIPMPSGERGGPIALDVYARWSLDGARRVGGFRAPALRSQDTSFIMVAAIAGRFGTGGAPALAMVGVDVSGAAYQLVIDICTLAFDGGAPFSCTPVPGLPEASYVRAVKLERPAAETDALAVLADGVLLSLEAAGRAPVAVPIAPPSFPIDVFPAGDCLAGEEVILSFEDRGPLRYRVPGGEAVEMAPIAGTLIATPCVGLGATGQDLRIYVANEMSAWLTMHVEAGGALGVVIDSWPVLDYDVSSTPRVGDTPRTLLGLQPMFSYLTLTRATLEMYDRPYIIPSPIVDVMPQFPIATRGGDVDGDGAIDVASLMLTYDEEARPMNRVIWSRLAAELDGFAVVGGAILPLLGPCREAYPDLVVYDFDGDRRDELVLAELGCSPSRVVLLSL